MLPPAAPLTERPDPLELHLLAEHQERYERIKAWREAQCDPYFTEVPTGWHKEFADGGKQTADGRPQTAAELS
jgi:hypothetical protein